MRAERTTAVLVAAVWALVLADSRRQGRLLRNRKSFCRAVVDLTQLVAVEGALPEEDAPPKKIAKFERRLAKVLNRVERTAPPEIVNDVSFASEVTYLDVRESPGVLGVAEPIQAIKRVVADECGSRP